MSEAVDNCGDACVGLVLQALLIHEAMPGKPAKGSSRKVSVQSDADPKELAPVLADARPRLVQR